MITTSFVFKAISLLKSLRALRGNPIKTEMRRASVRVIASSAWQSLIKEDKESFITCYCEEHSDVAISYKEGNRTESTLRLVQIVL